jgi:hypothetical protein
MKIPNRELIRQRCHLRPLRAAAEDNDNPSTSSLDEEARLEALERGVKRKQGWLHFNMPAAHAVVPVGGGARTWEISISAAINLQKNLFSSSRDLLTLVVLHTQALEQ